MYTKPRCSYQLHIQLCDIKPAIWRRIAVADTTHLAQLHRIIQAAMGWDNYHLYAFEIAGQRYGVPDADWPDDPTMDARRYSLGQLLQGQALPVRYIYDFGDHWQHRIKLEAVTPLTELAAPPDEPQCLAGRNACPPEDCGGPPGFASLLMALSDLQHPELRAARRIAGKDFDAKHFDLTAAQARIAALSPAPAAAKAAAAKRKLAEAL